VGVDGHLSDEREPGADHDDHDAEDDSVDSDSLEKPELPASINAWRTKNGKKPRKKGGNKRKEISPSHKSFVSENPFDPAKRSRESV
jgi:hypothetical protein